MVGPEPLDFDPQPLDWPLTREEKHQQILKCFTNEMRLVRTENRSLRQENILLRESNQKLQEVLRHLQECPQRLSVGSETQSSQDVEGLENDLLKQFNHVFAVHKPQAPTAPNNRISSGQIASRSERLSFASVSSEPAAEPAAEPPATASPQKEELLGLLACPACNEPSHNESASSSDTSASPEKEEVHCGIASSLCSETGDTKSASPLQTLEEVLSGIMNGIMCPPGRETGATKSIDLLDTSATPEREDELRQVAFLACTETGGIKSARSSEISVRPEKEEEQFGNAQNAGFSGIPASPEKEELQCGIVSPVCTEGRLATCTSLLEISASVAKEEEQCGIVSPVRSETRVSTRSTNIAKRLQHAGFLQHSMETGAPARCAPLHGDEASCMTMITKKLESSPSPQQKGVQFCIASLAPFEISDATCAPALGSPEKEVVRRWVASHAHNETSAANRAPSSESSARREIEEVPHCIASPVHSEAPCVSALGSLEREVVQHWVASHARDDMRHTKSTPSLESSASESSNRLEKGRNQLGSDLDPAAAAQDRAAATPLSPDSPRSSNSLRLYPRGEKLAPGRISSQSLARSMNSSKKSSAPEKTSSGLRIRFCMSHAVKNLDLEVDWSQPAPTVCRVTPNGSADRHRIRVGDRIVEVNGMETQGLSREQMLLSLQQRPLTLELERKAPEEARAVREGSSGCASGLMQCRVQ